MVEELITSAARHQFRRIACYAMPDHIHFLVHGKASSAHLVKFVYAFKQKTAYRCQKDHRRKVWQPPCCEHILRKAEDFESAALYIWNNPVQLKLCATPADYRTGPLTLGWKSHLASSELGTHPGAKKTILNVAPPFRAALSFTRIDFQMRFASDQGEGGLTRQME